MPLSWDAIGYGLAGLIGLALVARWLRLAESRIGDAAQAREMAENLLAGFVAHGAVVGTDGNAALVAGSGAVAMLKRRGAKVVARRLLPPVALSQDVEGVRVETGEQMFGGVLLFGVTADEVRSLESSLTFH
ncbi:hypothetical protein QCD71_00770 [Sphingomonas sp. PsM26]|jgi:hypothetical protein|nr:hypothetical protein [Sphingomonas sp. PsM26]